MRCVLLPLSPQNSILTTNREKNNYMFNLGFRNLHHEPRRQDCDWIRTEEASPVLGLFPHLGLTSAATEAASSSALKNQLRTHPHLDPNPNCCLSKDLSYTSQEPCRSRNLSPGAPGPWLAQAPLLSFSKQQHCSSYSAITPLVKGRNT